MSGNVTEISSQCPHCGAPVSVLVDPGSGPVQEYVEDCEVCCRPWRVRVRYPYGDEPPTVDLTVE